VTKECKEGMFCMERSDAKSRTEDHQRHGKEKFRRAQITGRHEDFAISLTTIRRNKEWGG